MGAKSREVEGEKEWAGEVVVDPPTAGDAWCAVLEVGRRVGVGVVVVVVEVGGRAMEDRRGVRF